MKTAELRERLNGIKNEFLQIIRDPLNATQWTHLDNALMMLKKLDEELKAE